MVMAEGKGGGGEERRTRGDVSSLSWRRTQPYAVVGPAMVKIFFGETRYGATKRCTGWGER
eukprot:7949156-Pyramimonas_sp.AAC.1